MKKLITEADIEEYFTLNGSTVMDDYQTRLFVNLTTNTEENIDIFVESVQSVLPNVKFVFDVLKLRLGDMDVVLDDDLAIFLAINYPSVGLALLVYYIIVINILNGKALPNEAIYGEPIKTKNGKLTVKLGYLALVFPLHLPTKEEVAEKWGEGKGIIDGEPTAIDSDLINDYIKRLVNAYE